ncbi:ECs_2282 family putative zinc-binding protein [Rahnella aceris]|jgi:hypothetical protein|uniref:ECs_2282 family putative zinc-binding protein n=1 Tax=Rahnella sp. (strain Y9602) TaxID=2703885 RepID=UPI00398B484C
MHIETVLEKFSCSICRCEFLIYPNDFNLEAKFSDVRCASCGRKVTKGELLELLQTGESKKPKKLITSML